MCEVLLGGFDDDDDDDDVCVVMFGRIAALFGEKRQRSEELERVQLGLVETMLAAQRQAMALAQNVLTNTQPRVL